MSYLDDLLAEMDKDEKRDKQGGQETPAAEGKDQAAAVEPGKLHHYSQQFREAYGNRK